MEQNLFTEGVRPGSVTPPEEVHMLICYIFREAGQPVTLDQANEVLQRQSLVNYFEFAEAAERLIRMGHLRPAENGRYTLSPEGEKLACCPGSKHWHRRPHCRQTQSSYRAAA